MGEGIKAYTSTLLRLRKPFGLNQSINRLNSDVTFIAQEDNPEYFKFAEQENTG